MRLRNAVLTRTSRPPSPFLAWASNRADFPFGVTSLTTQIYGAARISFWTGARAIKNPRFGWCNWYLDATGNEIIGTLTTFTITRSSIHWAGQTAIVNNDAATVLAGDTYEGPAFNCTIPANTQFWITTQIAYQTNGVRPVNAYQASARGEGYTQSSNLATINSQFDTSFTTTNNTNGPAPSYGYGEVVGGYIPSVSIVGDSIGSYGQYDNIGADDVQGGRTGGDAYFNRGALRRALHGIKGYSVMGFGRAGATVASGYGANFTRRKAIMAKASTHIISQLGQNSIALGESTLQAQATAAIADYATLGKPIIGCGLFPKSTSTDVWATVANQTAVETTIRDNFTAFLQAKVGTTLHSVLTPMDFLSPASPSADHGKWSLVTGSAPTDDGVHGNGLSYPVAATGVAGQVSF